MQFNDFHLLGKSFYLMDNYSGHNETPGLLSGLDLINTQIKHFPANATDLSQPADSFIIQKIKDSWTKSREEYMARFLLTVNDFGSWGSKSGTIPIPGKVYFLK